MSDVARRRHTTGDVTRRRRRSVRTERPDDPDSRRRIIAYSGPRRVALCQGPFTTFFDDRAGLLYLPLNSRPDKKNQRDMDYVFI